MTTRFPPENRYNWNNLQWRPGEIVTLFESLDFKRLDPNDLGGYFGEVFLVQELKNKIEMIAKSVGERENQVDKINAIEAFQRETYALLNLPPHPNVVESFIVHKVKRKDYIFMEHVDGGNLYEYIKSFNKESKKKNLNELYPIIHQMAEGLRFIHSNGFVHKDLKHDNILIKNNTYNFPTVKIADFGLMSIRKPILDNDSVKDQNNNAVLKTTESTIGIKISRFFASDYASPELTQSIVLDGPVNHLPDIFTFGILVLELITHVIGFKTMINYDSFLPFSAELSNPIDIERTNDESNNILNSLVKETLPFMYQTSIEGIKSVLNECWNIYNNKDIDNDVTWMNKLNALKLAKECNESLFKLVGEGPSLVYLKELEERVEKIENNKQEDT